METRSGGRLEVRSVDGVSKLVGVAVVYGSWSQVLYGSFRERFAPGSLTESLKSGRDILCTVNHIENNLLGRTSSRTLSVDDASDGLHVACSVPDVSYARDLIELINRGDVTGMSFIFDGLEDTWTNGSDCVPERTVTKADLYEVSIVIDPAYPATTIKTKG
jgi:HK97 family phage prohead protease